MEARKGLLPNAVAHRLIGIGRAVRARWHQTDDPGCTFQVTTRSLWTHVHINRNDTTAVATA
jgi:hypothetical protein